MARSPLTVHEIAGLNPCLGMEVCLFLKNKKKTQENASIIFFMIFKGNIENYKHNIFRDHHSLDQTLSRKFGEEGHTYLHFRMSRSKALNKIG